MIAPAIFKSPAGRWFKVAVCLILLFGDFKHSFVRHDPNEALASFIVVSLIALTVPWGADRRSRLSPMAVMTGALVASLALFGVQTLNPVSKARWAARTAANILVPSRYHHIVDQQRRQILDQTQLPPTAIRRPVHDLQATLTPRYLADIRSRSEQCGQ